MSRKTLRPDAFEFVPSTAKTSVITTTSNNSNLFAGADIFRSDAAPSTQTTTYAVSNVLTSPATQSVRMSASPTPEPDYVKKAEAFKMAGIGYPKIGFSKTDTTQAKFSAPASRAPFASVGNDIPPYAATAISQSGVVDFTTPNPLVTQPVLPFGSRLPPPPPPMVAPTMLPQPAIAPFTNPLPPVPPAFPINMVPTFPHISDASAAAFVAAAAAPVLPPRVRSPAIITPPPTVSPPVKQDRSSSRTSTGASPILTRKTPSPQVSSIRRKIIFWLCCNSFTPVF